MAPPPSRDGRASLVILVAEDSQVTQDLLKFLLSWMTADRRSRLC
jgi:hypothetical protein